MDGTSHFPNDRRLKIAVVGSGIAGMSAAWLLSRRHDVTLFEREERIGGHSHTVELPGPDGPIPVDTGFIVYNEPNYPNLTALFRHLGVATQASSMSFAASIDDGRLEYAGGGGLTGLFAQPANLARPRYLRMLREISRFYREAPRFLASAEAESLTLEGYLAREGYSAALIEDHLLPMGAAIWSTSPERMRAYPAAAFIRFFDSHGLLKVSGRPQWRTVIGGSRAYVKCLTESFRDRIKLGRPIVSVERQWSGVVLRGRDGVARRFDQAVIATHADEAVKLLSDASEQEYGVLGAFRYVDNRAVLHGDPALMPRRRRAWASWNFIGDSQRDPGAPLCISYWMNRLQSLPTEAPAIVTLNPHRAPDPAKVYGTFDYSHPVFDLAALSAQKRLHSIQGIRNTWFCGSYFGHGFHEDALQSGLAVAEAAGAVRRPWQVDGESERIWPALMGNAA